MQRDTWNKLYTFEGTVIRLFLMTIFAVAFFVRWDEVTLPFLWVFAAAVGAAVAAFAGVKVAFVAMKKRRVRHFFMSWGEIEQPLVYSVTAVGGLMALSLHLQSATHLLLLVAWLFPAGVLEGLSSQISAERFKGAS